MLPESHYQYRREESALGMLCFVHSSLHFQFMNTIFHTCSIIHILSVHLNKSVDNRIKFEIPNRNNLIT
jgi:hypothetical protein